MPHQLNPVLFGSPRVRARQLAHFLVTNVDDTTWQAVGDPHAELADSLPGVANEGVGHLVLRALRRAVIANPQLRRVSKAERERALERVFNHSGGVWAEPLWRLLALENRPAAHHARPDRPTTGSWLTIRESLRRRAVTALLLGVVGAVVVVAWLVGSDHVGQLQPIELFAAVALAFLPGWLFVRFLGQRAEALWDDYVLNLHRLGADAPQFLPRPPITSEYFAAWAEAGGALYANEANIYREKFDAYYGKHLARSVECGKPCVTTETVFPVLLTTAILAVAWTAVFWHHYWDDARINHARTLVDIVAFAFLGAYAFIVQMLMRRYFQNDLRAIAYSHAVVRLVTVVTVIPVLHQLPIFGTNRQWEPAVAFTIGAFPLVGVQALLQLASRSLRVAVPSLHSDYPLNQLDGLNVWFEAQLLEEGVEDMQNLATANLVDVILHTRVPVGRLVDWVDQSFLYLRLPPKPPGRSRAQTGRAGTMHIRDALRYAGIRDATSLATMVSPALPSDADVKRADDVLSWLATQTRPAASPAALQTAAYLLRDEPGLNLV
ncbi:MAG: hypothetical protein JWL83_2016, partial [Actinomycetia bacterium]|nr:hypothetical protein [Actinomycetes bacterium]